MTTFLVADDHAFIRRGLRQVLEKEFAPAQVIEAKSGQDAIEAVRQQKCDAVILDINLPDKSGIEVLKEIKLLCPTLSVVMLSLYSEEQYAVRAFKAGASGYLTKESEPEEFIVAIRKVMAGGTYVSPTFGEQLALTLGAKKSAGSHEALSDREMEVLRLIAKGLSLTQISENLALSVKTIGTYQTRIKEKLNLTTTASLIRYAIDNDLVE